MMSDWGSEWVMSERVSEWASEWVSEWVSGWVGGWLREGGREGMGKYASEEYITLSNRPVNNRFLLNNYLGPAGSNSETPTGKETNVGGSKEI